MTHGTCQICRRSMKITADGNIARHGHRNARGVGGGHCDGAYHLPLEQGRDAIDRVAAERRAAADRLEETRPQAARDNRDYADMLERRAEAAGH